MSRAEARAIWLTHVVDPDRIPPPQLAEVRKALIKTTHPDMGGNPEDAKLINAAYDVLKASPSDVALWQRAQEQREQERKRWQQYRRDYDDQRERERRHQEWVAKRAAQRQAEAQAEAQGRAEEIEAQPAAEAQCQRRRSLARRCYEIVVRIMASPRTCREDINS